MLTVWTRQGKKIIYLPSEAIDTVHEMLYTYRDSIIEYCIGYTEDERTERMEKLDNGKQFS